MVAPLPAPSVGEITGRPRGQCGEQVLKLVAVEAGPLPGSPPAGPKCGSVRRTTLSLGRGLRRTTAAGRARSEWTWAWTAAQLAEGVVVEPGAELPRVAGVGGVVGVLDPDDAPVGVVAELGRVAERVADLSGLAAGAVAGKVVVRTIWYRLVPANNPPAGRQPHTRRPTSNPSRIATAPVSAAQKPVGRRDLPD